MIICQDKDKFDKEDAKRKLEKGLKRNFYYGGREWPYKNVKPRIIAEKYMENNETSNEDGGLTDYKFYCFNGQPKFLYISQGLSHHETACVQYVTLDWKKANFTRTDYPGIDVLPEKPYKFDEMIKVCEKLSKGHSFLRVDLYQIDRNVYFSELTFYPGSGFTQFGNLKHDVEVGDMLTLPK